MSRRAWTGGGALLLVGVVVLGVDLHAMVDYHPTTGGPETATLGQVVGVLFGSGLLIVACLVLGTGLRRRFEARRRRRLRERLAVRETYARHPRAE